MRWVFLVLIVLNALYFVWEQQQPSVHVQQLPSVLNPAGVANIEVANATNSQTKTLDSVQAKINLTLLLGGFSDPALIDSLSQRLLSLDIDVKEVVVEEVDGVDYWVYMPPLVSRSVAVRQLKELKARQIQAYLINQGDMQNGISLSMLDTMDMAKDLVQKLANLGYTAEIKEVERKQKTYWLAVNSRSERLIDESLMTELTSDFPLMRYRQEMPQ
ncbi:SPOR domain-containing protein [Pseudomonas sp. F1_0610]|uniref:SPOR domain-containing protein n=1 Tax=Pseudomonas sp. F1_0610 TaxID=3114284 RepID=UPI0039C22699